MNAISSLLQTDAARGFSRACAVASLLLLAVGSSAPVVVGQELPAAADESEVQRFCTNIADAARDRRYALQAEELENLQADIDRRIAALEEKRAEYEEWMKRREEFLVQAEDGLVEIYSRMRADAAAERLAEVRMDLAAAILMKLDSRNASGILNEMERKTAATLTAIMAGAARRKDPT